MNELTDSRKDWKFLLEDSFFINRARTRFEKIDDLKEAREFRSFYNLLNSKGRTIYKDPTQRILALYSMDFGSIDHRVGLALFGNECFERHLGLDGTSVADSPYGQLKFLERKGQLVSLVGEKLINDPFGRKIYYLDLAGTLKTQRGSGLGTFLARQSLRYELNLSDKDVVFLTRTQNPMLVAQVRKSLPEGVALAPFWQHPSQEVIVSAGWMVESNLMSRNTARPDSHFDANESMIFWASYGEKGDGSSWEDMTKQLHDLDWQREEGRMMQSYMEQFGSSLEEARLKGHSFVLGAYVPSS